LSEIETRKGTARALIYNSDGNRLARIGDCDRFPTPLGMTWNAPKLICVHRNDHGTCRIVATTSRSASGNIIVGQSRRTEHLCTGAESDIMTTGMIDSVSSEDV